MNWWRTCSVRVRNLEVRFYMYERLVLTSSHHYLLCYLPLDLIWLHLNIPNSKSKFGSDCELWRVSPWLHVDAAIWSLAFFQESVLAYLRLPGCSSTMWCKWIGQYLQLLAHQNKIDFQNCIVQLRNWLIEPQLTTLKIF